MNFKRLFACTCLLVAAAGVSRAQSKRPNIVFAISDDQSWMHAGAYGDKATRTPAFDRVAREGVLFNYAYAAAPSCSPSRAAILTGRNIWELEESGILLGILKAKFDVFTLELEDAGYEVAATGKTWAPGRVSEHWTRNPLGKQFADRKIPEDQRRPGLNPLDYAANFDDFFAQRDKSKPFFFWLGATEPHQSYDVGSWKRAGKKLADARLPSWLPDNPVTRGEILDYGIEIEHFDTHVGRVLATLEKAGELDNTVVIVTSDHGNPLPRSKCNLYDGGLRVPFAVRWPEKIPAGRKVDDFISLADMAPTLLEIAGVPVPEVMSARSFWNVLQSSAQGLVDRTRDFVTGGFERHTPARRDGVGYPMRMIRTHKYQYIRNYEPDRWPAGDPDYNSVPQGLFGDVDRGETKAYLIDHARDPEVLPYYLMAFGRRPAEELYDMEKDPEQLHNVADEQEYAAVKDDLARRLRAYLDKTGDPRMKGVSPWDFYPYSSATETYRPDWLETGQKAPLPTERIKEDK